MFTKDSKKLQKITTFFTGADMVLIGPFCIILLCFGLSIQSYKQPLAIRYHPFDDILPEMRLTSSVIQKRLVAQQSICAQMCSLNRYCLSVNICGERFCEFNSDDVHFLNASVTTDKSCFYLGMKSEHRINCSEKGDDKNALDNSAICGTSLKRHDSFWGPWQSLSSVEIRRDCVGSGLGGKTTCKGRIKIETIQWYKWVTQGANWESAGETCTNFGGKLFDALDGTESQLLFLHDQLGWKDFWTGVRRNDAGNWTNQGGEVIADDVIRWSPGEPGVYRPTTPEGYAFARPLLDAVDPAQHFTPLCDLSV